MRLTLLAAASAVVLSAVPAIAQTANSPEPSVTTPAANIDSSNTRNPIAPRLPTPGVDENAAPSAFLIAARQALAAGRTGYAQEAMERAETRILSRSVPPSQARQASQQSLVQEIGAARRALATGDRNQAMSLIEQALKNPEANVAGN